MGSLCECNKTDRLKYSFQKFLLNFPQFNLSLLNGNELMNDKRDSDSEDVSCINDKYDEKINIDKYNRFKNMIIENNSNGSDFNNIYIEIIPNYNELNDFIYSELNANIFFLESIFMKLNTESSNKSNNFAHEKYNKLMNLSTILETNFTIDFLEEYLLKTFALSMKLFERFSRYIKNNKGKSVDNIVITDDFIIKNDQFNTVISDSIKVNSFNNKIKSELNKCSYLKEIGSDDDLIDFTIFERFFYEHKYFFEIVLLNESYFDYAEKEY